MRKRTNFPKILKYMNILFFINVSREFTQTVALFISPVKSPRGFLHKVFCLCQLGGVSETRARSPAEHCVCELQRRGEAVGPGAPWRGFSWDRPPDGHHPRPRTRSPHQNQPRGAAAVPKNGEVLCCVMSSYWTTPWSSPMFPGNVWDLLPKKKDLSLEYFCDQRIALGGFTLAYPVVRRLWKRLFGSRQALTR